MGRKCIAADHDDRYHRQRLLEFPLPDGGQAVHYRECDVHDDEVGLKLACEPDPFRSIAGLGNLIPGRRQNATEDLTNLGGIVDYENGLSHDSQVGNWNDVKRLDGTENTSSS